MGERQPASDTELDGTTPPALKVQRTAHDTTATRIKPPKLREMDEAFWAKMNEMILFNNNLLKKELKQELGQRMDNMEKRQDHMEERLQALESKSHAANSGTTSSSALGSSASTNPGTFAPRYLKVQGFSSWDDRKAKGVTRPEAEQILSICKERMPQAMQAAMGPMELRGLRSYAIKIPVTPSALQEVRSIIADILEGLQFPSSSFPDVQWERLYVVAEREPAKQKRYMVMGRAKSHLEKRFKEGALPATLSVRWHPHFDIKAKDALGNMMDLLQVDMDGQCLIHGDSMEKLGASESALREALSY